MPALRDKRLRILLVTRNFPPLVGGMESLMCHVYHELARKYDLRVVAPDGFERHVASEHVGQSCRLSPTGLFLLQAQWGAWQVTRRFRPHMVIAGSGLTAIAALMASRLFGATAICYLHGLDVVARSVFYQRLFLPAIRRCDRILVNSRNTATLAHRKGVTAERISVLNPGVAMPDVPPNSRILFRAELGLPPDSKILLSVGRLTARKGIIEFIEHVLPQLVREDPSIRLVIIGGQADKAVARPDDLAGRLVTAICHAGLEEVVLRLGEVDAATLTRAYTAADVHVFPVLDLPGDVEGFGMVALEAAAHGLPTVAFGSGGVRDAVSNEDSGRLVAPRDYSAMTLVIRGHLRGEQPLPDAGRCRQFAAAHSWAAFGEQLRDICRREIATKLESG